MVCKVQDYDILYNNADDQSIYERLPFYSHIESTCMIAIISLRGGGVEHKPLSVK
jgi:hypothetical protein